MVSLDTEDAIEITSWREDLWVKLEGVPSRVRVPAGTPPDRETHGDMCLRTLVEPEWVYRFVPKNATTNHVFIPSDQTDVSAVPPCLVCLGVEGYNVQLNRELNIVERVAAVDAGKEIHITELINTTEL